MLSAAAPADQLHGAVRDLYEVLVASAVRQPDGRHLVLCGSATLAGRLGKTPATVTKQLGLLRGAGLVVGDGRRTIQVIDAGSSPDRLESTTGASISVDDVDRRATAITVLASLASEFPELRHEMAQAVAIVATSVATVRDRPSRLVAVPAIAEVGEPSSTGVIAQDPVVNCDRGHRDSVAITVGEVVKMTSTVVNDERRRRRDLSVSLSTRTAEDFTWLSAEQLAAGIERARKLMSSGAVESAVSVLVSRARNRDHDFFAADRHDWTTPPTPPSDLLDHADVLDVVECEGLGDARRAFDLLSPSDQARYLQAVHAEASPMQQRIFEMAPDVPINMAADRWCAERDSSSSPSDHRLEEPSDPDSLAGRTTAPTRDTGGWNAPDELPSTAVDQ